MARPRKEGLDYFPHDTDAAHDEKVEPLRLTFGPEGYAFYFILLERIYRAPGAEIDISPPHVLPTLAAKVGIPLDRFMQIMDTALTIGSFDRAKYEQDHVLTSNGIKKRAGQIWDKRQRDKERYDEKKAERADGDKKNEEAVDLVSASETEVSTPEIDNGNEVNPLLSLSLLEKGDGDKVEGTERNENPQDKGKRKKPEPEKFSYAEFVSMTVDEYTKLLNRFGETDTAWMIEKLDNHKGAGGKKYKSDYRAILKWVVDALAEARQKGLVPGQPRAPDIPLAYQSLREWAEREDDP